MDDNTTLQGRFTAAHDHPQAATNPSPRPNQPDGMLQTFEDAVKPDPEISTFAREELAPPPTDDQLRHNNGSTNGAVTPSVRRPPPLMSR